MSGSPQRRAAQTQGSPADVREPAYDGVAVVLARIVPFRLHGTARPVEQLRQAIRNAFGVKDRDILRYACMGRQDMLYLVRTRRLEHVGRIWRPRGVRKLDIQYGYMPAERARELFENAPSHPPLVLMMYGKLDDRHLAGLTDPRQLWDLPLMRFSENWFAIRTLGWNDVLLVRFSDRLSDLQSLARETWETVPPDSNDPHARLFVRTYSVVGFRHGRGAGTAALRKVAADDMIRAPRIETRIRPGWTDAICESVYRILPATGALPEFLNELGHEDGTICFKSDSDPGIPKVNARQFLQTYYNEFLPAVSGYVHSTQLCIGEFEREIGTCAWDPERPTRGHTDFRYLSLDAVSDRLVEGLSSSITASSVDSLHAFYEACDWSMENEALRTTFGDLYWHLRWLLAERWALQGDQPGRTPAEAASALGDFAESLGPELRLLGDSFSQRLNGAYYGIMGYQAEHMFSHTMSLHKIVVGLWALHTVALKRLSSYARDSREFTPRGCWIVSHGERPMVGGEPSGPTQPPQSAACKVAQIPSQGVVALETIATETAHEIGHMLIHEYIGMDLISTAAVGPDVVFSRGNFLAFYQAAFEEFGRLNQEAQRLTVTETARRCIASGDKEGAEDALQEAYDGAVESFRDEYRQALDWHHAAALVSEVAADTVAISQFVGERFDLYASRILHHVPFLNAAMAVPALQRAYLQFCLFGMPDELGLLLPYDRLVDPIEGVTTARSWARSMHESQPRHYLSDQGRWDQFAQRLDEIAASETGLRTPDPELLKAAQQRFIDLGPAAIVIAALLEETMLQAWAVARSVDAENSGDDGLYTQARDAFRGLVRAAGMPEEERFDTRVDNYERLWHVAAKLLTSIYEPDRAGTVEFEETQGSPWSPVFERVARARRI